MVTIIIGVSRAINYKTAEIIPPFPEWKSGHYMFVLRNGELVHHEVNKSELL